MARSIKEIKKDIVDKFLSYEAIRQLYGINANDTFEKAFSPISLESILFYCFASAIFMLEKLFDRHMEAVDQKVLEFKAHTLRWYTAKAKAYRHGIKLLPDKDYYDENINKDIFKDSLVVKYAVANEQNSIVYIKVAGEDKDTMLPAPLNDSHIEGLRSYLNEIKDAGVNVEIINQPADQIELDISIYINPIFMNDDMPNDELDKLIRNTIKEKISKLPFDGVLHLNAISNSLETLNSIEAVHISKAKYTANGKSSKDIIAYVVPYAGYFTIKNLNITYYKYDKTEKR